MEVYPVMAFQKIVQQPASVSESKKQGTFVRLVPVPNYFEWEGHDVAVDESWIDRSDRFWLQRPHEGKEYLLFTLKIDGKRYQECKIQGKERRSIGFERADGLKPVAFLYTRRRAFGQKRIYLLELPQPEPKEITFNVETTRYRPFKNTNTGTVTFHLTE